MTRKKSMRRARKFYGILESRRQVVGGDDYKRDTGREREVGREGEKERKRSAEVERQDGTNPSETACNLSSIL